jgi:hypothetical protein
MAVNSSRSQTRSLREGATDGKYRKVRPDTEVIPGMGDAETRLNRSALLVGEYEADHGRVVDEIPLDQREVPAG